MTIETHIRKRIIDAIHKLGFVKNEMPSIALTFSKQRTHGDLTTNVAFGLAKKNRKSPIEVAKCLVNKIELDHKWIDHVEVAGAGFINFSLSNDCFYNLLTEILEKNSEYGKSDWGKGKKTQVEFVSANPTGPLTIGHGRGAVLGDTIARLLEATSHKVVREYYFNDAGRQMRILGDSVRLRYQELLKEKVPFPEDYYQGEYIINIAKNAYQQKGASLKGTEDVTYFQGLAEKIIFKDIKNSLKRLGIAFQVFYNEKSLYDTGKVDDVINRLRDQDLAYEQGGAIWFRATCFGQDQDRVIVKSTGEPTYRLPDIAYHKDKMDRGFDLIIDIFGADHVATYPDVLAGIQALGYNPLKIKVLIHQFVTLTEGKEKIKMSTRKANFITLDELMDEVGVDVTRYFFLNRSMSSHINFDLTLAKTQSDENPVYYVQYAHARICSILQHAKKEGVDPEVDADLSFLKAPEEIALIKILMQYPHIVSEATLNLEPHRISNYLEEVATTYHRFQHAGKRDDSLRVVTQNRDLTGARLALCRAARIVLANGLTLLGISKPERM